MRPDILIAGQGIAGTCLAWALEQAGLAFVIADASETPSATAAAAGIINPITGRRLVASWRIETLLPVARDVYAGIGAALGIPVWQDMRVRRLFADGRERAVFGAKHARGELAPFVAAVDDHGFWVDGGARVALPSIVAELRKRWQARGCWRGERVNVVAETGRHGLVIDCRGIATAAGNAFDFVPWEFSKGEVLELAVGGLEEDVVLNRRHWVLPTGRDRAWVGATHEPGRSDVAPSEAGRAALESSARDLLQRPFEVIGHRAGVRVNLPDRRPVVGRHPQQPRLGVLNGLGAKGALTAPWLARQWVAHLQNGAAFEPTVNVARFAM